MYVPDERASRCHDDAMSSQWDSIIAHEDQVGVACATPRRAHLVQDAGVVLAIR